MKRTITCLLIAVLLIACLPATALAAKAGDTVTVEFKLNSNPGITGYAATVNSPDSSALEFVSLTAGPATTAIGTVDVNGNSIMVMSANPSTATGVVFTATFKVLDGAVAGKTYNVGATVTEAYDADVNPVTISIAGGSVTIDEAPHEHVYGTAWEKNETHHWNECECGAEANKATHSFTWEVTDEADCKTAGEKIGTCSVCGYTTTEEIAKLSHEYTSEVTKKANCKETGVMTYTCSVCGDTYTEDIAKTSHTYTSKTEGDYKIYTCTVCGHSYKVDISDYDDVAGTGDITPIIALGVFGMLAAVVFVFKRRAVK